jgi:hypothetical protein
MDLTLSSAVMQMHITQPGGGESLFNLIMANDLDIMNKCNLCYI